MAIKIRLSKKGKKNVPYYHVVVADSRRPRDGKFIEKIGAYNPLLGKNDKNRFIIDKERAEYWLSVGATPSDRIAINMIALGIKGAKKYKPVFVPKQKKVKEKVEEKAEKPAEETKVTEEKTETVSAETKPAEEKPAEAQPEVKEETKPEAPKAE